MFTGIVQAIGTVEGRVGSRLTLSTDAWHGFNDGESIAVNGCCLTVVPGGELAFDLSEETLRVTTLGLLEPGMKVNLERALRVGDPLGGHWVQGHVDAVGEYTGTEKDLWRFAVPTSRYLLPKGSVTIDGVSLTVVDPQTDGRFAVALIPHTLAATTLGSLIPGQKVNIEYDILARWVEKFATKP